MTRVVRFGVQRWPVPCRFCGSLVVWATTDARKRMPLDQLTATDGLYVLHWFPDDEPEPIQLVTLARSLPGYDGPRWLCHWATCPERDPARHMHDQQRVAGGRQLGLFGVLTGGRS